MSATGPRSCSTLAELADRLRSADLIPSQQPLLERIDERFAMLSRAGITTTDDVRAQLENRKSLPSIAARSGLAEEYLVLLRRAVRSFWPRAKPLRAFDHWVPADVIMALAEVGITTTEQLRSACAAGCHEVAEQIQAPVTAIEELDELADLVRVQWVSPSFACALRTAGYHRPAAVASADPADLTRAVADANDRRQFFNATIGERDIHRIVHAASYVE